MAGMGIRSLLGGCVVLCAASGAAAQLTVVWTGAGATSNWSDPLNWDIQLVPCNDVLTFDVRVPANSGSVVADGCCTITHCTIEAGATLSIPAGACLTVLDRAEFDCTIHATGGTLEAMGANAAFHGSSVRVLVSDGGAVRIAAPEYFTSGITSEATILSADGAGSVVDLSSVTLLAVGFDDGWGGTSTHTVSATNGGRIDLSELESTTPPARGEDLLSFEVAGAGSGIDLSSLHTIDGSGGRTMLHASGGSAIGLPSLQLAQDAYFWALDGSRILVSGPHAVTCTTTGLSWSDTPLLADGAGSVVDLSSVTLLAVGFDDGWGGTSTHTVSATNGGRIDLSGLARADTPIRGEDVLRFDAQGGTIDAGSLSELGGSGQLELQSREQGDVQTGDWAPFTRPVTVHIDQTGSGSRIGVAGDVRVGTALAFTLHASDSWLDVGGEVRLDADDTLVAPNGGLLTIGGGGLFYDHSDEASVELSAATVQFDGAGTDLEPQILEVGGLNIGAMRHPVNTNFAIGRLVVGGAGPTVVRLADLTPNGNCGGLAAEAQYFYGLDPSAAEPSGLGILDGSTLVLGGLDAYLFEDADTSAGERLNDRFPPNVVAYEDGWIQQLDCEADWNGDGVLNTIDFVAYLNEWNRVRRGEPWQDWNPDLAAPCDSLNTADFIAYLNLFAAACDF